MLPYDDYGDPKQRTLLLLHGAAATDTFANQYELQDRFHLVVPHLPGSGRSVEQPYDPRETLEQLVKLIGHLGNEKVALMGHSLGGELAVALTALHPELFCCGIFLSPWVCSTKATVKQEASMARWSAGMLHWAWLVRLQGRYWGYTAEQAAFMAAYAKKITPKTYASFFEKRIHLSDYPGFKTVNMPMLAMCGSRELGEMKASVAALGNENARCQTRILRGGNHDFPMRKAKELNPILREFLEGCL